MPLVYEELRRLARRYMGNERVGQTLQATALVNEAYLSWSTFTKSSGRTARTSSRCQRG